MSGHYFAQSSNPLFNSDIGLRPFIASQQPTGSLADANIDFNQGRLSTDIGESQYGGGGDSGGASQKGLFDKLGIVADGIGGIGNLIQGFAALKGIGVAMDQLKEHKYQFQANLGEARVAANERRILNNNTILTSNNYKTKGKRIGGYTLDKLLPAQQPIATA